ncbi:hypothetical protein EZV62_014939 [Acer yangbiense]|uniref:Fucosyltransferase n=1 Tax=Acer yangbiense TaxID=1000413 RepID=A0A5C7HVM9_9ROSI|nr:hypothetical protein EZV62_014939 [Acer yangbiense]
MSLLKFPSSRNQSSTASTRSVAKDKFQGGLISPGFHEESSCISRYTSYFYHKTSPHKPSNFLISKLRKYEKLHKLCGPNSKPNKETLERLHSPNNSSSTECKYVVWIAYSGLGNRILTIASAFLYALLTNRILLIEQKPDMVDLFCEPFPNTSWLLPMNFPFRKNFSSFDQEYENSHGNLLKKNVINSFSSKELKLSSLYLHLAHDYDDHDKLFFCDENQFLLREVPWLIMRTDNYFVPSLFLMQSFDQELIKLFPNKETVFHHLGRYLFHPSNQVWGLITRYYQAYLSKADEKIGLQIRVIDTVKSPFQSVMDQILACTKKENLLPEIEPEKTGFSSHENQKISKAVLITSLYSGYFEKIKNKYWTHPTVNGEVVGVYQPSNEEQQKFENNMHNMKAWAEINLLSMCDVLVTSGWSTLVMWLKV